MKLKLQNIGIIEEAEITIDGITLIAGQNDSGKSTVGKVLYALVKGFNQSESVFIENKNRLISYYYQDILKELKKNWNDDFTTYQTKEINDNWINRIEELIGKDSIPDEIKKPLIDKVNFLRIHYNKDYNTTNQKEEELEKWLKSEFNIINNLFNIQEKPNILIEDLDGEAIISLNTNLLSLDTNLEMYFKEAFFIESPLIVNESMQRFIGKEEIQIFYNRYEELAKSLSNPLPFGTINFSTIYEKISNIINGEILVDILDGVRYKKNKENIAIKNTAVGIKSFGIIQLLLKNNRLNNRTLLIIDEPEVHLHPTWQVKYAEILVLLSKEFAIPIVLTSHSPYFIEALEAYSKKYNYESSTNYYFAEKNEDGLSAKIVEVNDSLSKIYASISEASYQLRKIERNE